ncbi:MAG: zinc/iron permease [Bryobacterales bacterium]|nr:zinc/iron permease [Bryobacterales bacterium]
MTAAWLLTCLAVLGIAIGAMLGQSRSLSVHLAAAGGGLLSGISLFWLIPEIARGAGWLSASLVPVGLSGALWAADRFLLHKGHSWRHGFVPPLMAATAVHSLLDGWSIRALEVQPMANIAVLLGLALHKLPEGLALGWMTRNALHSTTRAVLFCSSAEMLTVAGAWAEPKVATSDVEIFGTKATAAVLMLVAGSFLFLGSHTVLPNRMKAGIVPIFLSGMVLAGVLALARSSGIG